MSDESEVGGRTWEVGDPYFRLPTPDSRLAISAFQSTLDRLKTGASHGFRPGIRRHQPAQRRDNSGG
jgi:hypothetical protein